MRKGYPTEFKAKVLSAVGNGMKRYEAAKRFGVSEAAVRQWIKKEPKLPMRSSTTASERETTVNSREVNLLNENRRLKQIVGDLTLRLHATVGTA